MASPCCHLKHAHRCWTDFPEQNKDEYKSYAELKWHLWRNPHLLLWNLIHTYGQWDKRCTSRRDKRWRASGNLKRGERHRGVHLLHYGWNSYWSCHQQGSLLTAANWRRCASEQVITWTTFQLQVKSLVTIINKFLLTNHHNFQRRKNTSLHLYSLPPLNVELHPFGKFSKEEVKR